MILLILNDINKKHINLKGHWRGGENGKDSLNEINQIVIIILTIFFNFVVINNYYIIIFSAFDFLL